MTRKPLKLGATALLLLFWSLSVAAAPDRPGNGWLGSGVERARLHGTLQLEGEVFHVQGLELDERRIAFSSIADQLFDRGIDTSLIAAWDDEENRLPRHRLH